MKEGYIGCSTSVAHANTWELCIRIHRIVLSISYLVRWQFPVPGEHARLACPNISRTTWPQALNMALNIAGGQVTYASPICSDIVLRDPIWSSRM